MRVLQLGTEHHQRERVYNIADEGVILKEGPIASQSSLRPTRTDTVRTA